MEDSELENPHKYFKAEKQEISTIDAHLTISSLPDELLLHLFSFLGIKELGRCGKVCHHWKILSEDDFLWIEFCRDKWKDKQNQSLPAKYENEEVESPSNPKSSKSKESFALLPQLKSSKEEIKQDKKKEEEEEKKNKKQNKKVLEIQREKNYWLLNRAWKKIYLVAFLAPVVAPDFGFLVVFGVAVALDLSVVGFADFVTFGFSGFFLSVFGVALGFSDFGTSVICIFFLGQLYYPF